MLPLKSAEKGFPEPEKVEQKHLNTNSVFFRKQSIESFLQRKG